VPPGDLTAALAETPDLIITERRVFEGAEGGVLRQVASRSAVVLITGAGSAPGAAQSAAGLHVLQAPVKAARLRALCHYALSHAG
jgi:hypothetical protein